MASNLPARQDKTQAVATIQRLFSNPGLRQQLEMAIPKHMTVEKLLRVAMTSIRQTPKLLECSQESLLACVMGCAQLGLVPEPFLGQAYLVPFWNKNKNCMEAQLIPGYRGYLTLARQSGEVQSISAHVVYEYDEFQLEYGLEEKLVHRPHEGTEPGEVKGAYVIFRYKDGSHSMDYMTRAQIDAVRKRSKAGDSGPWVTDYPEMAKKTVIRRHVKMVPLSVEMAMAASAEDAAMAGESQVSAWISTADTAAIGFDGDDQEPSPAPQLSPREQFQASIPDNYNGGKKIPWDQVEIFAQRTAEGNNCSIDDIYLQALKHTDRFFGAFIKWQESQQAKPEPTKNGNGKKKGTPTAEPSADKPLSFTPEYKALQDAKQSDPEGYKAACEKTGLKPSTPENCAVILAAMSGTPDQPEQQNPDDPQY